MEVLANGFKANFWIPIEEEPDIDRFVDEQVMIDMDRFMLVGTLEKVSTCKKKNEEKEFEYFKQITIQVCNICSAADNNINIQIPPKKEEFLYDVKFRYAPEPEQVEGDGMEPAGAGEPTIEELTEDNDLEAGYVNSEGQEIDRETEEVIEETVEEEAERLIVPDERTGEDVDVTDMVDDIAAEVTEEEPGLEEFDEELEAEEEETTDDDDDFDDSMFDELDDETPDEQPVTDTKADMTPGSMYDGIEDSLDEGDKRNGPTVDEDDDGIDWGE